MGAILQRPPVFPVRLKIANIDSISNMGDEGAVLVTESPVIKEEVNDEIAVIDWVKKNSEELLERHRSVIDDHGIWIITKTYKSRRSAVAVMSSRLSSVELGVGASIPSILTLTPSSSWTSGSADAAIELHEDKKGVVAFFSGIYLTKRAVFPGLKRISRQDKQKKNLFRHGHPESETDDRTGLTETDDELQLFSCGLG
ncbi:hypothetical protein G7054_g6563 [Neopestalotiopsis clavispora]|nr:hypothetical protein G7054_g6563 [Neopestalotiopsis clavispora]